uniref:Endonuclease/exonuclease/phosphatase domain-containing protein n=1 Tax=Trichogramma kaykai TaxID=54128 RepID=A0ABD2WQ54_9HYME
MDRSRLASEELLVSAVQDGADVLLLQEPYSFRGRACALGRFSRCVITGQKGDEAPWAAVVVVSQNITAAHLEQYSSAHCVCVELSGAFGTVVVISQYHQFSHEPELHIDYLDLLLNRLGSRRVIIGMDLNGTSPQWSCRVRTADVRGALLEELMHRHDLVAVFRPGNPSTLVRGEKDVDVTLVTSELEALACDWTVREEWTTADHRPITFRLAGQERAGVSRIPRFNAKKADLCRYEREVSALLASVDTRGPTCWQEVDALAEALGRVLVGAAEVAIPLKKAFSRSVPWWNSRLTDLKKEFNRARRRFQREREPEFRSSLKLRSDLLRRRYARACWKARNNSWQKLVTQSTSNNPYGFIYKMVSDKIAPKVAVSTLAVGNSRTSGWEETALAMLDGFFADPARPDRPVPSSREAGVEPWTELEVLKAVRTMKSGKCPGENRIEADMIKVACGAGFLRPLTVLVNACLGLGRFPSGWKLGIALSC